MKTLICFLITGTLLFSSYGCAHAQNDNTDKQAIQMLTKFYTKYSSIKFISKDDKKFDSLIRKYCTIKLRKIAKDNHDNEYGTDVLTNENRIYKESLRTLTIVKDSNKENTYIVSYIRTYLGSTKKVTLPVTVVKENGVFKIANVANVLHDYQ